MRNSWTLAVLVVLAGCGIERELGSGKLSTYSQRLDRVTAERDSLARVVRLVQGLSTTEDVVRLAAVKDSLYWALRFLEKEETYNMLGLGWYLVKDSGEGWKVNHPAKKEGHRAGENLVRLWQEGINIRLELIRMEGPAE